MGEESGRLPQMLSEASSLLMEELTLTLKTVKRLMESNPFGFMAGVSVLILYGVHVPPNGPYEWAAYSYIVQKGEMNHAKEYQLSSNHYEARQRIPNKKEKRLYPP